MAKTTKPLFSTDPSTFTWSGTGGDVTGELVSYENNDLNECIICLTNTTTGGSYTVTIKCQMYFKLPDSASFWSALKTVTDEDGNALTFNSGTDTDANNVNPVANLYNQSWWGPNNGFRIVLTGNTDATIGGVAAAIVQSSKPSRR